MTRKILSVLLVVAVLSMTGCWEAFGHGFAQGYYGASYQPAYYPVYYPEHHPVHDPYPGHYPSAHDHYINDLLGNPKRRQPNGCAHRSGHDYL